MMYRCAKCVLYYVKEGRKFPNCLTGMGGRKNNSYFCSLRFSRANRGQINVEGLTRNQTIDWGNVAPSLGSLVPQEISLEPFEKVINTVRFSRGLFGKNPNDEYVEIVLRQPFLWDKKDCKIMQLSGGMKRRVLIAKALAHELPSPFLDEPSAGVDGELHGNVENCFGVKV